MFKGFDKDMKCRGFQYEVGAEYEHDSSDVSLCSRGFHSCENPFAVWNYYGPVDGNRFAEVEIGGQRKDDGQKTVSAKLKIKAELTLPEFIRKCVEWITAQAQDGAGEAEYIQSASGYSSKLAASGYSSKLAASGDYSQLAASGDSSKLESTGEHSVLAAIGPQSRIKGVLGNWITLAEYDRNRKPVCVKSAQIDGDALKPDTWYILDGGEFVEA